MSTLPELPTAPGQDRDFDVERQPLTSSGMAKWAFAMSFLFTPLGFVLGLIALGDANRTGRPRGLAIAAICICVCWTALVILYYVPIGGA